ncbi:MAG: hypothetical protein VCA36_04055, partial [Opitutales bacterium]
PPTTSNVLDEYQGGLDDWTVGLDYKLWENVVSRVEYLPADTELDDSADPCPQLFYWDLLYW